MRGPRSWKANCGLCDTMRRNLRLMLCRAVEIYRIHNVVAKANSAVGLFGLDNPVGFSPSIDLILSEESVSQRE